MFDSVSKELAVWISQFKKRIDALVLLKGAAYLGMAALIVTLLAVFLSIRQGFPNDFLWLSRGVLFATLIVVAYIYVVLPRRRLQREAHVEIERLAPAFDGRIRTFSEALERSDGGGPLLAHLAQDAIGLTPDNSPVQRIPNKRLVGAATVAISCFAALISVSLWGPANYSYGVRSLWLGWILPGIVPEQLILVTPGDDGIRAGGRVRVQAKTEGFQPQSAFVHARFESNDWQRVPMSKGEDGFEFTFFSVREPLEYYVAAAEVRSPTYSVKVIDVPDIEKLVVTLEYPEWTGKSPDVRDPGGDVRAIEGTRVTVTVASNEEMVPTALIVDDQAIDLDVDGQTASGDFSVRRDGQYYVAAMVGGERIRLSDDYFITRLDDEAPEIEFTRPGRDWSASAIEEVTTQLSVTDDYKVDAIELFYSVNGGEWASISLDAGSDEVQSDHVFLLESLSSDSNLVPGDLVAYYAVAKDRELEARTDIFFIDVQPFDRRYSQSQQSGSPMSQGNNPQNEISKRQKEIIISTWNLIREEQNQSREHDDAYVMDNAALLSRLQSTLKGQVDTLVLRTQARELTGDSDISRFIEHLKRAAAAMEPASERLGEIELEQAILPEQEALQHLLRAEAVFSDISISLQANSGGGGGQAGRDLAEMFEMEMDLEKNQYETGSQATPETPQTGLEEAVDELAELARRQERLAEQQRRNGFTTPEQRWQQQRLRRDVEELRERLEQLSNSSQSSSEDGASGNPSTPNEDQSQRQQQQQRELEQLKRRLDSALRAMNEAEQTQEAGEPGEQGQQNAQQAMDEAQRQLVGARDQANAAQTEALKAQVEELAREAEELHRIQAETEEKLQDAVRRSLRSDDPLDTGLTYEEERELATGKQQLLQELQALTRQTREAADDLDEQRPGVARQLRQGIEELRQQEIETRLSIGAAHILDGNSAYVASSESMVTEALRQLKEDLDRASRRMATGEVADQSADRLQALLQETRQLRRALEDNANPEQQQQAGARGRDDLQRPSGMTVGDLDSSNELRRDADEVVDGVRDLLRDSENYPLKSMEIAELAELASGIRSADFSGNPELLETEFSRVLDIVEQLELSLAKTAKEGENTVRTRAKETVSGEHEDIAAEYFRRLGEGVE
ncbi:MAG: hypothetical protein AAF438_01880 [Pseudomonadota bacterium]